MATTYSVYSPCTGWVQGATDYCNTNPVQTHKLAGPSGFSLPLDIGGSGYCRFSASGNIKSVRVVHQNECCLAASACNDWTVNGVKCGVEVELYKSHNAQDFIGSILYCHVQFRSVYGTHGNGAVINRYSGTKWLFYLGLIPSMPSGEWTCYRSKHIHMQVRGSGGSRELSCGNSASAASTRVYKWVQ